MPADVKAPKSLSERLNWTLRLLWTGMSFALFGLGALVLGTIVMPLVGVFVWNAARRERIARALITAGLRIFIWVMDLVVLDYRATGLEAVSGRQRCLIVANHPSLIDVVFLLALFPGADCVVKRAMWSNPFTMLIVRFARYIPNDDTATLLDAAVARLEQGRRLILFPEGTRTVPGAPPDFKRGAALVALQANADIIPVRIRCAPTTLTKAEPWYAIPERAVMIRFDVLQVIEADQAKQTEVSQRQASFALNQRLEALLAPGVATPDGTE